MLSNILGKMVLSKQPHNTNVVCVDVTNVTKCRTNTHEERDQTFELESIPATHSGCPHCSKPTSLSVRRSWWSERRCNNVT